ncbi:Receptor-likey region [Durusdinium trenchii]|uniref:Transmembrane domain-and RING domain-containing protein 3 n=1 Tax=Durusdinium trenchii TaxID=1381693 RepID=A0ABP0P631_9DINO
MYHPQVPGIPNLVYTEKTQRSEGSSLLTSLQDDLALVAPASPAPSPRQRSRSRSRASAAVAAGTADDVVDLESPAEMPALPSFYVHTFEYGDVARCCMACREFFLPGQLRLGVLLQSSTEEASEALWMHAPRCLRRGNFEVTLLESVAFDSELQDQVRARVLEELAALHARHTEARWPGSGVMSLNSVISDSLLGDWTRASNILVRKAAEREEETPRSQVDPADFQLEARAELSGPAKRAAGTPSSSKLRVGRTRTRPEEKRDSRSPKVLKMLRECLQIAHARLAETSSEVTQKLSKSLTPGPHSSWPAHLAPCQAVAPSLGFVDLESSESKKASKRVWSGHCTVEWFQVKLVKVHAFNEKLERLKRQKPTITEDPELLQAAFQEALSEARRIQAQTISAKNEVERLKNALARQKALTEQTRPGARSTLTGSPSTMRPSRSSVQPPSSARGERSPHRGAPALPIIVRRSEASR